jgi:L-lactate dehydrogenase (cytochrome)
MKISTQEISKHNKPEDAWVVIENEVYDVTDFAPSHPGGVNGKYIPSHS